LPVFFQSIVTSSSPWAAPVVGPDPSDRPCERRGQLPRDQSSFVTTVDTTGGV
jgi:hypothetical protein